ncbi:MAG: hypothetical protein QM655_05405 [Nocardioidaceae bacterium]
MLSKRRFDNAAYPCSANRSRAAAKISRRVRSAAARRPLHLYDEVGIPAPERRLPGDDGLTPEVEIPRWAEVGPRYGLEVVGPGIPA